MALPGFKNTTNMRSIVLDASVRLAFIQLEEKYQTKRLDDLAAISSGGTPSRTDSTLYGGDIPWAKISDITAAGKWISDTEEYITESAIEQSSAKLFPVGTVFFSMYGSIGKTSIAKRPITTNQAILGLIPSDDISSEFLYYALINARESLFAQSKGTSQKNINGGMVKNFEIPVPPVGEQRKVVEFLSLVEDGEGTDHLVNLPDYLLETRRIVAHIESLAARVNEAQRLREEADKELTTLLISMAHRSDTTKEKLLEKGWKEVRLSEIIQQVRDRVLVEPNTQYPNLGIYSFARGLFHKQPIDGNLTSAKELYRVHKGQFIYSRLFAFEGACGFITDGYDNHFVSGEYPTFDCDPEKVKPEFLYAYFKSLGTWKEISAGSKGLGDRRQRVQPEKFLEHKLLLPPLDWQEKIVSVMAKVNALRGLQSQSQEELDALLPSVLDRAFRGEL